jgi:hypothetical protein
MNNIPPLVIVQKLFPEFYREEYPTLVSFLEAYYEFLSAETSSGKILGIRDLDSTLDVFANQLRKELALSMPDESLIDTRELIRNAKAFYSAKGTESSYKFLFRALFGTDVEIFYPSSVVLKASDGRWEQDTEIQAQFTSGNVFDLVGRRVRIDCTGQPVIVFVNRVRLISGNNYELLIDRNFIGDIQPGDTIGCPQTGIQGNILPILSSVKIIQPGTGFSAGQLFDVIDSGTGAKIRVSRTTQTGGLRKVELVKFGNGYTGTFNQVINNAELQFIVSGVARYPGFFSSSNGFLSDTMRLQDNEYYQSYSYVLRLDESIERYRSIVKALLHPVGWALFGELNINKNIDLGTSILETTKSLVKLLSDTITISDQLKFEEFIKGLSDQITFQSQLNFNVSKYYEDELQVGNFGSIFKILAGNYADDYFLETGLNNYTIGGDTEIREWNNNYYIPYNLLLENNENLLQENGENILTGEGYMGTIND